MKVVLKRGSVPGAKPNYIPPPIPFERPTAAKEEDPSKTKGSTRVGFDLRAVPGNPNSQTYKLYMDVFSDGTPEEWLLHMKQLDKVLVGQNCLNGPEKFAMARRVMDGDALAAFDEAARVRGDETNENFKLVMQDVTSHIFPRRALQVQCRYMRRFLQKPKEMKISKFMARLSELNAYLAYFPPFGANYEGDADFQRLDTQELLEIAEFAVPNSWLRMFVENDFEPMDSTIVQFVNFCERLEQLESMAGQPIPNKKPEGKSSGSSEKKSEDKKNKKKTPEGGTKECAIHGTGNHSTGECFTVKKAKKRHKTGKEGGGSVAKAYKELHALVADLKNKFDGASSGKNKRKAGKEAEACAQEFENLSLSDESSTSHDS